MKFILYLLLLIPLYVQAQNLQTSLLRPPLTVYMLKNDTIYSYNVYKNRERIDSVIFSNILTKSLDEKYWFYEGEYASYECKFTKKNLLNGFQNTIHYISMQKLNIF
jgi:hypothetical protein